MLRVIKKSNNMDLKVGSMQHIKHHIQSEPATAIELEAAIASIEDELEPVIPSLPAHRTLVTSELLFQKIAGIASDKDVSNFKVDDVERLFNCLADVAYGTPAKLLGIPENREFAAGLLFLRELMHHANFSTITLLNSTS